MTVKLYIATPCYGGNVAAEYATSMMQLSLELFRRGITHATRLDTTCSLITRGRNRLAHAFLKTDATHLLWIDADLRFRPQDVLALLESGHDVCGGAYPRKQLDAQRIHDAVSKGATNPLREAGECVVTDLSDEERVAEGGFIEVHDLPTGFMLIRRHVLEEMATRMPDLLCYDDAIGPMHGEPYFGWFDCMIEPETRRPLSEDYAFCRRWQQLGGKCHLYVHAEMGHVGRHIFEGRALADYEVRA